MALIRAADAIGDKSDTRTTTSCGMGLDINFLAIDNPKVSPYKGKFTSGKRLFKTTSPVKNKTG